MKENLIRIIYPIHYMTINVDQIKVKKKLIIKVNKR